jgi:surface antigen
VRWRSLISREATSGSLDRFPLGIGAPETFSKIKLPKANLRNRKLSLVLILKAVKSIYKLVQISSRALEHKRALVHVGLVAGVALTVFGSSTGSVQLAASSLSPLHAASGNAADSLDEMAASTVAATIASKTSLLVTNHANQQATALSSQLPIPTSAEGTLAKRQVVTTAGDASRGVTSYTVEAGDTLGAIASKFNITSSTVIWANNLENADSLRPGQQLVILPVSGLLYAVQAGDTAEALAAKYQANAAQILSYNNAEVKGLVPGQKVIIPEGVKPAAPKPRLNPAMAAINSLPTQTRAPSLTQFSGGANGYSYGYCTWYVANRRSVPSSWGNAVNWYYSAKASGFGTGRTPVPGAIAWSAGMSYWGHVGIVEAVDGDRVLISDMNGPGGWNRVSRYWTSTSAWGGYIY